MTEQRARDENREAQTLATALDDAERRLAEFENDGEADAIATEVRTCVLR